jgi:Arc/MetJ-type ribon-helix-helix transcriptional regulator
MEGSRISRRETGEVMTQATVRTVQFIVGLCVNKKMAESFIYYFVLSCLMESVTIKVEESMSQRMGQSMKKKGYGTKTEFIREAIRDKLERDEREELLKAFMKFKGKAKRKTTNAENKRTRDLVARELAKEFGIEV